jgi:uncharacterized protein (UPF0333 family)
MRIALYVLVLAAGLVALFYLRHTENSAAIDAAKKANQHLDQSQDQSHKR